MNCPDCNKEMNGTYCDDDQACNIDGMLYRCKCGAKFWEEDGQELKRLK